MRGSHSTVRVPGRHWQVPAAASGPIPILSGLPAILHFEPGAQSMSFVQPTVQASFTHACGAQSVAVPATQVPAPSHVEAATSMLLFPRHAPAAQTVPAGSGAHEPALPARLQAAQAPQGPPAQQTPSVHIPLAHSGPAAHAVPFGLRLPQAPATQL